MLTVGQLAQHLSTLDPILPIGVIDIDRHPGSQRTAINLRVLTDVDVVHDDRTGEPQAVWLTAQTMNGAAGTGPRIAPPTAIVLPSHPCGCLIPITAWQGRNVNLDAYPCRHHQPNDIVVRSAQRASG